MTIFLFSNFGQSSLAAPALAADVSLWIDPSAAAAFPVPTIPAHRFALVLYDGMQPPEIVWASFNGEDGNFTVERAKEGTVARNWPAGTAVLNSLTKESLSFFTTGGQDDWIIAINQRIDDAFAAVTLEAHVRVTADDALAELIATLTAQFADSLAQITFLLQAYADINSAFAKFKLSLNASVKDANANATLALNASVDNGIAIASMDLDLKAMLDGKTSAEFAEEITALATASAAQVTWDTTMDARVGTTEANVTKEITVRAGQYDALVKSDSTLTASIAGVKADLTDEITLRVSETGALATRATKLEATVDTAGTGLTARLTTLETATASDSAAQASRLTTLEAEVGDTMVSGLQSRIKTEESARATADTTEASLRTTLESLYNRTSTAVGQHLPSDFAANGLYWRVYNTMVPIETAWGSALTFVNVPGVGRMAEFNMAPANAVTAGYITYAPGRTWQVTFTRAVLSGAPAWDYTGYAIYDENDAYVTHAYLSNIGLTVGDGLQTYVGTFNSADLAALHANPVRFRPLFLVDYNSLGNAWVAAVTGVVKFEILDITDSIGSKAYADAKVSTEASTRAAADIAEASLRTTVASDLKTESTTRDTGDKTLQTNIDTVTASVVTEAKTRATDDASEAALRTTLTTNYNTTVTQVVALQQHVSPRDFSKGDVDWNVSGPSGHTYPTMDGIGAYLHTTDSQAVTARNFRMYLIPGHTYRSELIVRNTLASATSYLTHEVWDKNDTWSFNVYPANGFHTVADGWKTFRGEFTAENVWNVGTGGGGSLGAYVPPGVDTTKGVWITLEALINYPSLTSGADVRSLWIEDITEAKRALTDSKTYSDASVSSEASTRSAADLAEAALRTTVASDLKTETTTRDTNDKTLQTNIDTVTASVKTEATTRAADDLSEAALRTTVASDLKTETTNRTNADTTLSGDITTTKGLITSETSTRTSADTALAADITTVKASIATTNTNVTNVSTAVANLLPSDFRDDGLYWASYFAGGANAFPADANGGWTYSAVDGARVAHTTFPGNTYAGIGANSQQELITAGRIPLIVGHTSRLTATVRHPAGGTACDTYLYFIGVDSSDTPITTPGVYTSIPVGSGWTTVTGTYAHDTLLATGARFLRPMFRAYAGQSGVFVAGHTFDVRSLVHDDITEALSVSAVSDAAVKSEASTRAAADTAEASARTTVASNLTTVTTTQGLLQGALGNQLPSDFAQDALFWGYYYTPSQGLIATYGSNLTFVNVTNVGRVMDTNNVVTPFIVTAGRIRYLTGRTWRVTVKRAVVSGGPSYDYMPVVVYDDADLYEIHIYIGNQGHSVADGWVTSTATFTSADIFTAANSIGRVPSYIRPGFLSGYNSIGTGSIAGHTQLAELLIEDITEATTVATASSALVTAEAATRTAADTASSSLITSLTSSVMSNTGGYINRNADFRDYPTTPGLPTGTYDWNAGATGTRQQGRVSQYAYQQVVSAGTNAGIDFQTDAGSITNLLYVLDVVVEFPAGADIAGTVAYIAPEHADGSASGPILEWELKTDVKPIGSASFIGSSPSNTAVYAFSIPVDLTNATTYPTLSRAQLFVLSGFTAYTIAAHTVRWSLFGLRPATEGERQAFANTGAISTANANIATNTASIATHATTLSTLDGRTQAYYQIVAAAGAIPAYLRMVATGFGSEIALAAKTISMYTSAAGGFFTKVMELASNLVQLVVPLNITIGTVTLCVGPGIGASGDLVLWYGLTQVPTAMTKANGLFWLDNAAQGYFGGGINVGYLTTGRTTTDLSSGATVSTPDATSNGHAITVTLSYALTSSTNTVYGSSAGAAWDTAAAGLPGFTTGMTSFDSGWVNEASSTTITLDRSLNAAAFAYTGQTLSTLGQYRCSGTRPSGGDPGNILKQGRATNALTYTDTGMVTQTRAWRATMTSRTWTTGYAGAIQTQTVTVTSAELP